MNNGKLNTLNFAKDLIKNLEIDYPEKFLKLVGSNCNINDLQSFLKEKNFPDAINFDIDDFLIYASLSKMRNEAAERLFKQSQSYKIINDFGFGPSAAAIMSTKVWV